MQIFKLWIHLVNFSSTKHGWYVIVHITQWVEIISEGEFLFSSKVEKILKGSLDLIPSPSPSVKIQIMGRKVCLSCKGKKLLCVVNKLLKNKKFVDITQQCFAFTTQANFPAHISNFHLRWWDLFYFNLFKYPFL